MSFSKSSFAFLADPKSVSIYHLRQQNVVTDENPFRSRSYSLRIGFQCTSAFFCSARVVFIQGRDVSVELTLNWLFSPLEYHFSIFDAILKTNLRTIYLKPQAVHLRGRGRGGTGWIQTLLNVIYNFKELKRSLKDGGRWLKGPQNIFDTW